MLYIILIIKIISYILLKESASWTDNYDLQMLYIIKQPNSNLWLWFLLTMYIYYIESDKLNLTGDSVITNTELKQTPTW